MDLRRQAAIARKWLLLLLAIPILAAGATYVLVNAQHRVYEATSTLIVGQSLSSTNPDYTQLLASQRLTTTYAIVVTTRPILDDVISELHLDTTADALKEQITADTPDSNTLLTITARDTEPARAAAIANALANRLVAESPAIQGREIQFQASIDAALQATQDQITSTQTQQEALAALDSRTAAQDAELATLEGRLVTLRSTYATLLSYSSGGSNLLSIIEPAEAPTTPIAPRPTLYGLLAGVVGLLLAAAFVFVVEYLDDTIKDADAVQEVAGMATLGQVARLKGERGRSEIYRLVTVLYPRSAAAEAYRTLRANIEFTSVDRRIRRLLVTSAMSGEGKTVTAANLAVALAQAGRRVLLVDADLRKPGVHALFDLPNASGLTTLLRDDTVRRVDVVRTTDVANLSVLTSGPLPPNPAELLSSQRMDSILDSCQGDVDILLIDAPPTGLVADAVILATKVDGTLVVIDARRSRRGALRQAREALDRAGAHLLGAVLNRIPGDARLDYSGYYVAGDESPRPLADESGAAPGSSSAKV